MPVLIVGYVFALLALISWIMVARLAYQFHVLIKRTTSRPDKNIGMLMLFACLIMLFFLAQIAARIALSPDEKTEVERHRR